MYKSIEYLSEWKKNIIYIKATYVLPDVYANHSLTQPFMINQFLDFVMTTESQCGFITEICGSMGTSIWSPQVKCLLA